jgi:nicotinamide-nucleotide amidase
MERLVDRLPDDVEALARDLLEKANDHGLSLATAESCTGGLISAILTDIQGMSHRFERGFVVYSDAAKAGMLGIPRDMINAEGAVSRAVAIAMAQGTLNHSPADIGLAVTGFAGPAGPGDEPGLVHFPCVRRGRQAVHQEEHFGDCGRGTVRIQAVRVALAMMIRAVD